MTAKERFERIEHVKAGLVEERRKDREEYRQLWRDTQQQISELSTKINEVDERLGRRIEQFAEASRAADERLRQSIEAVDKRLGDRIDSLVSAIGALAASTGKPNV
jgi:hypothetical protein